MTWLFKISFGLCFILIGLTSSAQLPACFGPGSGMIYFLMKVPGIPGSVGIYNYDPSLPFSTTNPYLNTAIPLFHSYEAGLALGTNISGPGPSPTFYISSLDYSTGVGLNYYYYYNGSSWISTGHIAGAYGAVNPAAGGGFIYSMIGNGDVYKYDGTGNAVFLCSLSASGWGPYIGPWDLAADCQGNFYVLRGVYPVQLEKYNPSGTLIQTWTSPGIMSVVGMSGSFAMVGDTVYSDDNGGGFWKGVISGSTISFTSIQVGASFLPADGASCPLAITLSPSVDTVYYCPNTQPVVLNASGLPPHNWTVLNGPATISGSGSVVTVSAAGSATIICTSSGGECGPRTDTIRIIVPTASISAGVDDTISGCGNFLIGLTGFLTDTVSGLIYNRVWSPAASILSGGNTLTPTANPSSSTGYVLEVSTPANQGGCNWMDTVTISILDSSVIADFNYDLNYGCTADTVVFYNASQNAGAYAWNFYDGQGSDLSQAPIHLYAQQGIYNVTLIGSNGLCADTIETQIDTRHPLAASFTVDDDTICQGTLVNFTNSSTYTTINGPAGFAWDFQGGFQDTSVNTQHLFNIPGVYDVLMTVTDFVPCMDTAYHTIVVDPYPDVSIKAMDSIICEGQGIEFAAEFAANGNVGLRWDFGDGIINTSSASSVMHAYDTSGTFIISLNAKYRSCNDTSVDKKIEIKPFPVIDLGPDTVMCPGSHPILIGDYHNQFNPLASWRWNTGDTTSRITVPHPGIYTARVTIDGCSSDDSIEVFKDCYLDIPNSFTPNGDGLNDYFLPREMLSKGLMGFKMAIWNRWGQLIFETSTVDGKGWDGKFNGVDQPEGVYIYLIEAVIKNGQQEKYKGNLTLVR